MSCWNNHNQILISSLVIPLAIRITVISLLSGSIFKFRQEDLWSYVSGDSYIFRWLPPQPIVRNAFRLYFNQSAYACNLSILQSISVCPNSSVLLILFYFTCYLCTFILILHGPITVRTDESMSNTGAGIPA